jgi:hemolysin D
MKRSETAVPLPAPIRRRHSHEFAFLPAALEILDTPASPVGRAIGCTVIAFFVLALAWATFGKVDIVATATGKIVPTGKVKIIQPFEIGTVRAIPVEDGQAVKRGAVLIELDPTAAKAEVEHLRSDLLAARLDAARLEAALASGGDPVADFRPPEGADPALIALHRQFLLQQTGEQRAKLDGLDRQRRQKEAERATVLATIGKINAALPLLERRVAVRKYLNDHEYGSKLTYLQEQQDLVEHQHDLLVQNGQLAQTEAALAGLAEQRRQTEAEYRRALLADLTQAEAKAAGLAQDLVKAEERARLQLLTAPVDGVVQQLQVHTIGGVVTPAQQLMVIVPADSRLEIEAMVQNKDIGFVHEGQEAEIKIDTFNFTRYGLLHGRVLTLSQDAVAQAKPATDGKDRPGGAEPDSSEPKGQELVYVARISLDRTQMRVEGKLVDLGPGMAVTAEIKTGSRRVIEYLLSPVMKYSHESLRER